MAFAGGLTGWYTLGEALFQEGSEANDTFGKSGRRRDQAEHQVSFRAEIVEVSRMRQHSLLFEQRDGELFIARRLRHAHNRVPATFRRESFDRWNLSER